MNRQQRRKLEREARREGRPMSNPIKPGMRVPIIGSQDPKDIQIQKLQEHGEMLRKHNVELQKKQAELITELRSMGRVSQALYESYQDFLKENGIEVSKEEIADRFLKRIEKITQSFLPTEKEEDETH